MKITVECLEGTAKGLCKSFEEHDTLIVGRDFECGIRLPNDPSVSRHHFILEINPPQARLRDFGSLNGTYVDGKPVGKRNVKESPQEGARRSYPQVDLNHGALIKVGKTVLMLTVEAGTLDLGTLDMRPDQATVKADRICPGCGSPSGGGGIPGGDSLCSACREGSRSDPLALVGGLLQQADSVPAGDLPLPDYEIGRKLGSGAFGAVYLARHKPSGDQVALKMILAQVAATAQSREFFLREMSVQKELTHPNIVRMRGHGSQGGAFYFVMDYCDGGDVAGLISKRGGKVPFEEATRILLEALEGLAFAHARGFVHRDLKPANLLLTSAGGRQRTLISDFGLAKNFQKAGLSGLTVTGALGGTPDYMPREQITNFRDTPPASDVFSMAASYYAMLAGVPPRERQAGQDPIRAVLQQPVVELQTRVQGIPDAVAVVIRKALQPMAKDRYPTAAEFRDALQKALKP